MIHCLPRGPRVSQKLGTEAYNLLLQVPSGEVLASALLVAPGLKPGLGAYAMQPHVRQNLSPDLISALR